MTAGYAGHCRVSLYPTRESVSDKKYIKAGTNPAIPSIPGTSSIHIHATQESAQVLPGHTPCGYEAARNRASPQRRNIGNFRA